MTSLESTNTQDPKNKRDDALERHEMSGHPSFQKKLLAINFDFLRFFAFLVINDFSYAANQTAKHSS